MLDALDLDEGKVMVRRQRRQDGYAAEDGPLKQDSRRSISIAATTVETIREQLQRQLDDAKEWGEGWQATGHVFTREDGSPWHPDRVSKLFDQAVKAAALPRIRLHDLRHTWATLALRAGIHPKVVQERLGHKTINITLDTYSHVLPDMQESAAELVAALVDGEGDS
jgi:integrase